MVHELRHRRLLDASREWCKTAVLMVLLAIQAGSPAQSSDYPNRTVTIVAPAAPGGLYSLFARLIGNKLEQRFGQPFIVENRPGASSIVGSMSVIRAPHDGYTLLVANSTGLSVNPTMRKNLPYDPVKDFAPIALLGRIPEVLVVNAALPIHSIADIATYAKSRPGGLSYASAGAGTGQHLSGFQLASVLGIEMTHVPYKGMSPAINDVAGGHIPLMFSPIPFALPLAQAGKVRMLGITTAERSEIIPDVPPLTEIGVKDFRATTWWMLVAAADTRKDIVETLHREVRAIIADQGVRKELLNLGILPVQSPPPDELKRFVQAEIVRVGEIVTKAGLAGTQ
jgi:tripartite-type tricarboxylate transporter receptor subunit TctC